MIEVATMRPTQFVTADLRGFPRTVGAGNTNTSSNSARSGGSATQTTTGAAPAAAVGWRVGACGAADTVGCA
jgi:hypothetical protein